jgi:hypothetical protein
VQRERPIKTKAQPKRDIFVREVAGHLRSTTKAKTWCEWENDENFEIYCQQVHEYETIQSSLRWLECETRSWNYAKMLMEEGKSSSGALSFSQARAMMVEYFNIRLGNDVLVALCRVSQTGTISRVQEIIATYKRLAGPSAFKKNVQANTSNLLKEVKLPDLSQTMEDTKSALIQFNKALQQRRRTDDIFSQSRKSQRKNHNSCKMKSWPCYCSNATSIKLGNRDSQK